MQVLSDRYKMTVSDIILKFSLYSYNINFAFLQIYCQFQSQESYDSTLILPIQIDFLPIGFKKWIMGLCKCKGVKI